MKRLFCIAFFFMPLALIPAQDKAVQADTAARSGGEAAKRAAQRTGIS